MIITAGRNQVPLIVKAKAMGCDVLVTDQHADAPALLLADATAVVDSVDKHALLKIASEFRPDAIVTEQTDVAIPAAAFVADSLGLPGIGAAAALRATDKFAMREACRQAGIPTPQYRVATNAAEALAAANDIGLPAIIKPTDNQASRGVAKIDDANQLEAAVARAFAASRNNRILVEQLMTGPELSIDSFIRGDVIDVLGICEKKKFPHPFAFDFELTFPGVHSAQQLAEIKELNERVIRAIGLRMGFSHAEMIITPQGVRLIEIAARGCGARVATDLLPRLTNIDLLAIRLSQALGDNVDLPAIMPRSYGILRFFDFPEGTVRRIGGMDEAAAEPGVIHIEFNPTVGSRITKPLSGDQRHGFVLGIAPTRAAVCQLADKVTGLIEIDVV